MTDKIEFRERLLTLGQTKQITLFPNTHTATVSASTPASFLSRNPTLAQLLSTTTATLQCTQSWMMLRSCCSYLYASRLLSSPVGVPDVPTFSFVLRVTLVVARSC